MRLRRRWGTALLLALPVGVISTDVLRTNGYTTCLPQADIKVENVNIAYNRLDRTVTFDVAGSSSKKQNVTASLTVMAYGKQVYQKSFDPCDPNTKVDQLCPVPIGHFGAKGSQDIPQNYADMIPPIAFQLPDLDGTATLELKSTNGGNSLACIESHVNNGKTIETKAVSYVAISITGAALVFSGVSALAAGGAGGGVAPGFGAVLGWFQSIATNGMMSVDYPPVYRSFTKNFAFSGGLIPWGQMQTKVDDFRNVTGGNLTADSFAYLQNVTLAYSPQGKPNSTLTRRGLGQIYSGLNALQAREVTADLNGKPTSVLGSPGGSLATVGGSAAGNGDGQVQHTVHGIQAYVERLKIPVQNTFMTVLLVFAVVIAAIALGILLFKVILEAWALFGSFPTKLIGFRKRYWGLMGRTIVNLILMLYGIWTLYCIYELTHGDSWAVKTLAGVSLAIFTAVLAFFTFKIWQLARRYRKAQGDHHALYEDKDVWIKYSLFYDQYKKDLWWIFIPTILYMFARGCVIAAGDGHGMFQTGGQLIVEALMLGLLIWSRPFVTQAGNWIHIIIQVVRALSVVCIIVFVEELGVAQSTKTVTGVALIAVQSVLTVFLGILIIVNAIIVCCRENPHRKQRKEAEKLSRDLDNLTPLDARNSLLIDPRCYPTDAKLAKGPLVAEYPAGRSPPKTDSLSRVSSETRYNPHLERFRDQSSMGAARLTRADRKPRTRGSGVSLVGSAAGMGYTRDRSGSQASVDSHLGFGSSPPPPPMGPIGRQPTLPNVGNLGYRGTAS